MRNHWSDLSRSCIVALALLGLAALLVFKIPHGFEEAVAWYLVLLPGAFFAAAISGFLRWIVPGNNLFVFYGLLACLNFIWYCLICFGCIKIYRFVSQAKNSSRL
jgi:O-antigen/teichoic acid export membrane protein